MQNIYLSRSVGKISSSYPFIMRRMASKFAEFILKLMAHTMEIWKKNYRERALIGNEQFSFMADKGTTNAIFAFKDCNKDWEKRKSLYSYLVFSYLEKS